MHASLSALHSALAVPRHSFISSLHVAVSYDECGVRRERVTVDIDVLPSLTPRRLLLPSPSPPPLPRHGALLLLPSPLLHPHLVPHHSPSTRPLLLPSPPRSQPVDDDLHRPKPPSPDDVDMATSPFPPSPLPPSLLPSPFAPGTSPSSCAPSCLPHLPPPPSLPLNPPPIDTRPALLSTACAGEPPPPKPLVTVSSPSPPPLPPSHSGSSTGHPPSAPPVPPPALSPVAARRGRSGR